MTHARRLLTIALLAVMTACADPTVTDPSFGKGGPGTPTVTSTSPTGADLDTTLDVRIFGTNFEPSARADLALAGVVSPKVRTNSTRYISATELVANVTIALDADTGLYDVMVTVSTGKKGIGTELFTVKKRGGDQIIYETGPAPTALAAPSGFTEGYARTIDDAGWILGRPKTGYGTWSWHVDSPNSVTVVSTTATPLEASGNARGDVIVNLEGGGDGVLLKTPTGYDGPIRLDDPYPQYNGSYMNNAGEIDDDGLVVGSVVPPDGQHAAFWVTPTSAPQLVEEPPYYRGPNGGSGERTFTAISASGLIAGRVGEILSNGSTLAHSWLWQASKADGMVTVTLLWELPPVPGSSTGGGYSAFSMNAGGTIVGYHYTNAKTTTVRWVPDAAAPSGYRATELALNNTGYDPMGVNRCGFVAANMSERGIVWKDGNTVVTLPPLPGGTGSFAKDINANGDVVGHSVAWPNRKVPAVRTPVVWKRAAPCP